MTSPFELGPRELEPAEIPDCPRGSGPPSSGSYRVERLLPTGYESYVRIFHPFRRRSDGPPMPWSEMAARLGVPQAADVHEQLIFEFQASGLSSKDYINLEGEPDPVLMSSLVDAPLAATGDESVYFLYGQATQIQDPRHRSVAWFCLEPERHALTLTPIQRPSLPFVGFAKR
jgi:hypothetical protein